MRIRYFSLTNFRNYTRLELTLPQELLLIHGANAQGKTSLIEAMYLLATGSSPIASSDRELIQWQAEAEGLPYARVWAEIERRDRIVELEIALEKRTLSNGNTRLRKTIRVDRTQKKRADLTGKLNVVLFMPQNVDLVAGSPSGRRRYLNDTLCQVDETYSAALDRYTKALRQRNAALRHIRDERGDPAQLVPFEDVLARDGVVIADTRRKLLEALSQRAHHIHQQLTGGAEWLRLDYEPNFDATAPPKLRRQMGMSVKGGSPPGEISTEELIDAYRGALLQRRSEEIARGVTVFGPHRDEVYFTAGSPKRGTHEVDLRTYGSRGQQRTAVLSLKLAELAWMREQTGEAPVLLFDEVLAELDRQRRGYLLERVNSVEQAILTATDPQMFNDTFLKQATLWEVADGIVKSESAS